MFFFFNDTATTEIYTLSLHDALPIAVGGIDRTHPHHTLLAGDDGFEIAGMFVQHAIGGGQARRHILDRSAGEDGDAVIAFLSVYGAIIAQTLESVAREILVHAFDFLQAHHIRLGLLQPGQRRLQPGLDGVHIPGCDLQTEKLVPQPQEAVALGLLILKAWPIRSSVKSISAPARKSSDTGSISTLAPSFSTTRSSSSGASSRAKLY